MSVDIRCDIAIIGGGLAGGLIAYALHVRRPDLTIRLIEPGERLGGNRIWSFFSNDIAPEDRWLVEPFISARWNGYDVAFPTYRRSFGVQFNTIRSERFDARLRAALPPETPVRAEAWHVHPKGVALADGRLVRARGVIDAGGAADLSLLDVGWQKYLGQLLRTARPHGLTQPILMDADVEQDDGFRFVYCLPFGVDRVLIEDSYYSDRPEIDCDRLRGRIAAYAEARGWQIGGIDHEEEAALPVVMAGDFVAYWRSGSGNIGKAGARAGLFHPTTGYALPDAVRTAAYIASLADLGSDALHVALHEHARARWAERSFYRMLNRMLFRAAKPNQRYQLAERFFRLNVALIGRFYAAQSTPLDRLRIVGGWRSLPIRRALAAIRETAG